MGVCACRRACACSADAHVRGLCVHYLPEPPEAASEIEVALVVSLAVAAGGLCAAVALRLEEAAEDEDADIAPFAAGRNVGRLDLLIPLPLESEEGDGAVLWHCMQRETSQNLMANLLALARFI